MARVFNSRNTVNLFVTKIKLNKEELSFHPIYKISLTILPLRVLTKMQIVFHLIN